MSTYPLIAAISAGATAIRETRPAVSSPTAARQGIYNAALALLSYDVEGRPVLEDPPRLLEYGYPGEPCSASCRPPVWISVVGRTSAWPVRAYPVDGAAGYVFAVTAPAVPLSPALFPSPSFHALLFLLTSAVLIAWATGIAGFRIPAGCRLRR